MNASSAARRSERLWSLDLLRILATIGIVILHTSPIPPEAVDVNGLEWKVVITVSVLFRWCVPAFLMISGALFLPADREIPVRRLYRKNIMHLASCFLFWSAFYAVVHCVIMGKGKWTFINQLLRGHYHMWYIFVILGLYMITPLVRKMTESRKMTEYFLILGLVFVFLVPRTIAFIQMFSLPHADVIDSLRSAAAQVNPLPNACMLYYFVLGHYLTAYPVGKRLRGLLIPAAIAACAMTAGLTIWHSALLDEASGHFYGPSSTTVLIMTVCVFLLFKHGFAGYAPQGRMKAWVTALSACSFGVYLVHPFFVERLQLTLPLEPAVLVIGTLASAFGIYIVSLAVSYVLRRIPVLGRHIV